jgi:hypothetical protein
MGLRFFFEQFSILSLFISISSLLLTHKFYKIIKIKNIRKTKIFDKTSLDIERLGFFVKVEVLDDDIKTT